MKKLISRILLLLITLALFSCSQNSSKFIPRTYHNLAARYNCYFLAKERMLLIDDKIRKNHQDDFNYILPYYPPLDTNFAKSLKTDLDYVVEKALIPIQKHKNSNWLSESFNIIGKTKWLENKMDSAIYVHKYVLARVKDTPGKQRAQVYLLRTYITQNDWFLAEEEYFQLKKQKIFDENALEYNIACTEYHYAQREFPAMIPYLVDLLHLVKKKDDRARINFILGQIHQRLGSQEEAYTYYKKAMKRNPPYEIEFNSKLNISQVTDINDREKIRKINKYYDKMLVDLKNQEYKSRIYYERAKFEHKQGHLSTAVQYLNKSLAAPGTPIAQKAYPYLMLGELHYAEIDTMPTIVDKYSAAKLYYDSTVTSMEEDFEGSEAIKERQIILANFVEQLEIVKKQEKLQRWATLSDDALYAEVSAEIARDKAKLEAEIRRAEQKAIAAENSANNTQDPFNQVSAPQLGKSSFFAYNPVIATTNKSSFEQYWGLRVLEDNWRRADKPRVEVTNQTTLGDSTQSTNPNTSSENETETQSEGIQMDTSSYYAEIPRTLEKLASSKKALMDAKYKLAKIYYYDLDERTNARDEFISYLEMFPNSKYEAEVLYFMFLICQTDPTCSPETYKSKELTKYPNSIYAKFMENKNYLSSNEEQNRQARDNYEQAFDQFKAENYLNTLTMLANLKATYPNNDIPDKVEFLRILTLAKTDQVLAYYTDLEAFVANYGTSNLKKEAQKRLNEKPADLSAFENPDTEYYPNDSSVHFFVGVFDPSTMPFERIDRIYNEFRDTYLRDLEINTKKVQFSTDNYFIVNKSFADRKEAEVYLQKLMDYHDFGKHLEKVDYSYYLVNERNYKTLLSTKNIDGYSEFYRKQYGL